MSLDLKITGNTLSSAQSHALNSLLPDMERNKLEREVNLDLSRLSGCPTAHTGKTLEKS